MLKFASDPPSFVDAPTPEESSVAASSSADTLLPVISDVSSEVVSSEFLMPGEGDMRRLGTFSVSNAAMGTFILQLAFVDGGVLKHVRGAVSAVVRLRDMELRYTDIYNRVVVRKLREDDYRGRGYIYEVEFLDEDVQELYEMELWGITDASEASAAGRRGGGLYSGEIGLHIERLLSPD
ncbi:MAG: hypothetical protein FWC23_09410 [Chitinispirillia bacterium]|nr:hypothetical protein [Chitinispirillia bacterium]MCL2269385.1 hypothetical protein [Chitinispirillia bacterium]